MRHEQGVGSPRKAQVFGYGMEYLQTPISHDDSPDGVRPIFHHIPPGFRKPGPRREKILPPAACQSSAGNCGKPLPFPPHALDMHKTAEPHKLCADSSAWYKPPPKVI